MVLPFGLTTAPWAFTEVVKQIKKQTIPRRYVLFQYLDDWLNAYLEQGRIDPQEGCASVAFLAS